MEKYQEGYKVMKEFAEAGAKAKMVSSWYKKKIPVEIRKTWYEATVVAAIAEYNMLCQEWLKEHGE